MFTARTSTNNESDRRSVYFGLMLCTVYLLSWPYHHVELNNRVHFAAASLTQRKCPGCQFAKQRVAGWSQGGICDHSNTNGKISIGMSIMACWNVESSYPVLGSSFNDFMFKYLSFCNYGFDVYVN